MSPTRTPRARADGLLLVDKPAGITSFAVVARVRRLYGVRQVGHAGTLDPLATGLLPVLVGEATKATPWTMGLDKVYLAGVLLGAATDTFDAEGRVVAEADPDVDDRAVAVALAGFVGVIQQRPPAFSAIKRNGQPLYRLARRAAEAGEDVGAIEVEERQVTVHAIELVERRGPRLTLRIHCGKGTYVRSIAHQLGLGLGTFAHLESLRRLRIGPFDVADAHLLDDRAAAPALAPLWRAVAHLPALALDAAAEARVRAGQQAVLDALPLPRPPTGPVRLMGQGSGGEPYLVAIVEPDGGARGRSGLSLARVFAAPPGPHPVPLPSAAPPGPVLEPSSADKALPKP